MPGWTKINTLVDVGLILQAIQNKGWSGIDEASARCHVSEGSLKKLLKGEIPRLDSLFRICDGLGISVKEVIVAPTRQKKEGRTGIYEIVPSAAHRAEDPSGT